MNEAKDIKRTVNWKLWSGLLISALFLYLAFREVDLGWTWAIIRASNLWILTLAVVITFLQYLLRSFRWYILLEAIKKTGFSNRLTSILIGFAANCILPARLGEFIRANYLGLMENISRSSVFGTIVIERIIDGFTLLLILWIGLWTTGFPEEFYAMSYSLRATGFLLLFLYLLIIVLLACFKHKKVLFIKILERLLFFISRDIRSKVIDMVEKFAMGLIPIKTDYGRFKVVSYSLLIWFLSLCQIKLIAYSIGISISFMATFLILSFASFGVMIPSAPGFIGTFHLAVQYGFILYGVAKEEALSTALLWHATFFFPTILWGAMALLWIKIPYGKIPVGFKASEKE